MLCARCKAENADDEATCRTCGASLARHSSFPAARILSEPTAPERREATIVFADIGGYSEWMTGADVEEVAEVMQTIKERAVRVVEEHGGIVNQFVGDEVMAIFGFPVGHEDDPRRAVGAALALHEVLRDVAISGATGRPLLFHTGIDTGLVLAQSRDVRDGVFDLTGAAVNTAARLRSHAGADEILISERTRALSAPFFETGARGDQQLKGIEQPVTVHAVRGRSSARTTFDAAAVHGLTRYVGRGTELAELVTLLEETASGEARLVSIAGPPGVGKTRLVHELIAQARAREFTLLRGQCQSYGDIPPFQPFLDTLQDGLQVPDLSAPDVPDRIIERSRELGVEAHVPIYLYLLSQQGDAQAIGEGMAGQNLREAVIEALGAALVALSELHPVLVIVEDWHYADEGSDDVFRSLARATAGRPIMAVVTYRSQDIAPDRRPISLRHFELQPFDVTGTAELLQAWLGLAELPAALAAFVHDTTDGNPFFIEEVCHSLVDSGVLVGDPGSWVLAKRPETLQTPATLQAMVRARVDKLAPQDKELLKLASVIGAFFSIDLLSAIRDEGSPMDGILSRLEERAHILGLEPESYRFKHAIIQEVAYNVLLLRRRRELHGRLGDALEERHGALGLETLYESLAHHFGNSLQHDKAVRYAELAGDKAVRSFSLDQGGRQYLRAIRALQRLPSNRELSAKQVELVLKWAIIGVHNPTPQLRSELQSGLALATELGDAEAAKRCLCWMGWVEYALGHQKKAVEHYDRCMEMAVEQNDQPLIVQLHANIGMSRAIATDYGAARGSIERVLSVREALLSAPGGGTPGSVVGGAGFGYALGALSLLEADQGAFDPALTRLRDAQAAVRASGKLGMEGAVETIAALVHAMRGQWRDCHEAAERVRSMAERTGAVYQRHMARALGGLARYHGEGDTTGIELMREAAVFLDENGIGLSLSWNHACVAEALSLSGQHGEALTHAERAIARAQAWDALGEASAHRARASALAGQGEPYDEAMVRSIAVAERKQSPREVALSRLRWIELDRAAGRTERVAARMRELEGTFESMGMDWYARRLASLRAGS